jgi:hypothetical protein
MHETRRESHMGKRLGQGKLALYFQSAGPITRAGEGSSVAVRWGREQGVDRHGRSCGTRAGAPTPVGMGSVGNRGVSGFRTNPSRSWTYWRCLQPTALLKIRVLVVRFRPWPPLPTRYASCLSRGISGRLAHRGRLPVKKPIERSIGRHGETEKRFAAQSSTANSPSPSTVCNDRPRGERTSPSSSYV